MPSSVGTEPVPKTNDSTPIDTPGTETLTPQTLTPQQESNPMPSDLLAQQPEKQQDNKESKETPEEKNTTEINTQVDSPSYQPLFDLDNVVIGVPEDQNAGGTSPSIQTNTDIWQICVEDYSTHALYRHAFRLTED